MPARPLPPFVTPGSDTIDAGVWILGRGDHPLPLRIDDWDYSTTLYLSRRLTIDTRSVLSQAHLRAASPLAVVVIAESTSTGIRRVVFKETVREGEHLISFELGPEELGGTLVLTTEVVSTAELRPSTLGASRPGSVLWSSTAKTALEGDAARFPIELVSFVDAGLPSGAPWLIQIRDDDLERPASAAAQVLINADHPSARKMAIEPTATAAARTLADSLQADVAIRMLRLAISNEELEDSSDQVPGSIGEALVGLVATELPHRDLAGLRSLGSAGTGRVEAELLGALEVYGP